MICINHRSVKTNKHCDDSERHILCQTGSQQGNC